MASSTAFRMHSSRTPRTCYEFLKWTPCIGGYHWVRTSIDLCLAAERESKYLYIRVSDSINVLLNRNKKNIPLSFHLFWIIPDGIYLAALREEHVTTINEAWTYKSSFSALYIKSLILLNEGCIGLFDKKTDELLSWLLTNDTFAAGYCGLLFTK